MSNSNPKVMQKFKQTKTFLLTKPSTWLCQLLGHRLRKGKTTASYMVNRRGHWEEEVKNINVVVCDRCSNILSGKIIIESATYEQVQRESGIQQANAFVSNKYHGVYR